MSTSISQKERDLIIARLEISEEKEPSKLRFYSGASPESYSKQQILDFIKQGNPIGDEYVKMQFEFLRTFKGGEFGRRITPIPI